MQVPLEGQRFDSLHVAVEAYLKEFGGDRKDPIMVIMALGAIQGLVDSQAIQIRNVSTESRLFHVQNRESLYYFVHENPSAWLVDANTVHMAGGLLPTIFGRENDPLWQEIKNNARDEKFTFAGISLTLDQMRLVGDFARFLLKRNFTQKKRGECVDERLEMSGKYAQIHCNCGACEAIGKSIGLHGVEDDLHQRLDPKYPKRPILSHMKHHSSTTIYTDLGTDTKVLRHDLRMILSRHFALPFNASVPIQKLQEFSRSRRLSTEQEEQLINAWCLLNIQIPRNIIAGHNDLNDLHEHTAHVVHTEGVKRSDIGALVMQNLKRVPHASLMIVGNGSIAA